MPKQNEGSIFYLFLPKFVLVPFSLLNALFKIHLCAEGQLEAFVLLIPGNPVLTIYIELKQ